MFFVSLPATSVLSNSPQIDLPHIYHIYGMASEDRAALLALFRSSGGANWTVQGNWGTNVDLSQWGGVKADDQGRVTKLELELLHNPADDADFDTDDPDCDLDFASDDSEPDHGRSDDPGLDLDTDDPQGISVRSLTKACNFRTMSHPPPQKIKSKTIAGSDQATTIVVLTLVAASMCGLCGLCVCAFELLASTPYIKFCLKYCTSKYDT